MTSSEDGKSTAPAASVGGLLQQAMVHQQAGRLDEAEALYEQLVPQLGEDVRLLHWFGVLCLQRGKFDRGLEMLERASARGPNPAILNDLGEAFRRCARPGEAVPQYQRALKLAPEYQPARVNMAMALAEQGKFDEALAAARQVPLAGAGQLQARTVTGEILERAGRWEEAAAAWQSLARQFPDQPEPLVRLGIALGRNKDPAGAVVELTKAVQMAPKWPVAQWNLAMGLSLVGRHDAAIEAAKTAVELAPQTAEALNILGTVYDRALRREEAEAAFREALKLRPNWTVAMAHLGGCLDRQGRIAESIEMMEQTQALQPGSVPIATTMASLYMRDKRYPQSLVAADRAVSLGPNDADAHGARALALLSVGDFERGFIEYEWRWRCQNFDTPQFNFRQPMWDGSDPSGRTVMVHQEQGFGDIIHFTRYLPMIAAAGATVVVECPAELRTLMKNVRGVSRAVAAGLALPAFDLHVPILSLPALFHTTRETIPGEPYLKADADRIAAWREKLDSAIGAGAMSGEKRIGLAWGGRDKPDPRRTVGLASMAPLARVPGVVFVSLQKGPHAADAKMPPEGMRLIDLSDDLKDFGETAALMANLDAVVTIDSAVAHLAGGLGARTFLLLPFICDWRWMPEVETTPWYPTMRLFRQKTRDEWFRRDWSEPVEEVRAAVGRMVGAG
jgi:tetratricopeptide (TPR) repeat protein